MFQFQYTCKAICADGKLKCLKSTGFFRTSSIFLKLLESWDGTPCPNGGTYHYFQDADDYKENIDKQPIPDGFKFSRFQILHNEPNPHHHNNIFVSPGDIWGKV